MNKSTKYRLKNQYDQIDYLLRDLNVDFVNKKFSPKKWSIHEHIGHLGRYHEVFINRIKLILDEENPKIERYVAEHDPKFNDWVVIETSHVIEKSKELRIQINQILSKLSKIDLNRIGVHTKFREINILEWTEFFLLHEMHHFYSIFRLIREHR